VHWLAVAGQQPHVPENTPLAEEPPNKRARKGGSAGVAREQQRQGQGRAELVPGKGQEQAAVKGNAKGRGRGHGWQGQ
jgi:hypothetical protein